VGVTATLAGHRAVRAHVALPAWGAWYADVELDAEATLSGAVALKIAGLTLSGTVISGGPANGRSRYRIVAGAGGWGTTLPPKAYANDAGVKASAVLVDAATACGEQFDATTLPTTRLGPHWARHEGPACRALEQIAPSGWYIGEDGVTRIGARTATAWTGKAAHEPVDHASGSVVLAPETLEGLVPGAIVDGLTAVDVHHEVADGKLRSTIWGKLAGTTSRRLDAWRSLIDQIDPARKYRGIWEYRVVTVSGSKVNLQPVRVSAGMPDLARVPMAPGVAGAKSTLLPGARVLVCFVDASPARPMVVGFEDADGEGFTPVLTSIDATTFVKLADGARLMAATGDLAGGIWPIAGTTRVMG